MDKPPNDFKLISKVIDLPTEKSITKDEVEELLRKINSIKDKIVVLAVVARLEDRTFCTAAVNADVADIVFMAEILKDDALNQLKGK